MYSSPLSYNVTPYNNEKNWSYKSGVLSIGKNLVLFYFLIAYEIWSDKKGDNSLL